MTDRPRYISGRGLLRQARFPERPIECLGVPDGNGSYITWDEVKDDAEFQMVMADEDQCWT